jgi:beta-galactosidase
VLKKAITHLDIKPGEEQLFDVAPYLPVLKPNADYHINLRFTFKDSTAWADKHFIIAENQFEIQSEKSFGNKSNFWGPLEHKENETTINLSGKDFSIRFNKSNGALSSYIQRGVELIRQPFLPHFTRPQTDNDKRGWKTHRVLKQWFDAKPKLINMGSGKCDGMHGSGIAVISTYSLINDSATVDVSYCVFGNGVIEVSYYLKIKQGLPNIPKVGMQMAIEKSYNNISWFGRGPFENYIDKNYAADVGLYNLPINQFMENYVVPQENGNRTDVRWMFLNNLKTKDGLLIVADSLLSMSAWPYTEENIQNAKHTNKLKDAGFITLNME